jgi:C1A family cysteine protease
MAAWVGPKERTMSKKQDEASAANAAQGFSGFGGHLLASPEGENVAVELGAETEGVMSTLQSLGIEDAEQVVAVAAIPQVREELKQVLGLKDKAFEAFLEQMQKLLPPTLAHNLMEPGEKNLGLGVLPPTPEMQQAAEAAAVEFEAAELVRLPAMVNLVRWFQPIRNQGPRGTCVSFTVTAICEYIERRRGILRDLSEQHLYYETKLIDGAPGGCGTWQAKAAIALRTRGECREAIWPYRCALPCNNHGPLPPAARPDGMTNRLNLLVVPTRNVLAYKSHMAMLRPVGVSIPVYNSWYQSAATRQTGRITMRIGNEPAIGGHAVCLVGYVDTPASPGGGYFIVRNSWGTTAFGSANPFGAGYGTIPYQYIANDAWEAFTAAVPGIDSVQESDEEEATDDTHGGGGGGDMGASTVTINVGKNVKITIENK